jgi:amyloid beta precursor protein binding protein 1
VADLTVDIGQQSAHKHGHIPYLALLLHYLAAWKADTGSLPTTYKDKNAFKKFLAEAARTDNAEGGEENFDEAIAAVMKTVAQPNLSSSVREVFEHTPNEVGNSCKHSTVQSNTI